MKTSSRILLAATAAALGTPGLLGPIGASADDTGADVTSQKASLIAFGNPYGDGRVNPTDGGTGQVHAVQTAASRSIVTLHVAGLVPDRAFGAHVHVGTCAQMGLGHYMHDPVAGATPDNEVWLDFRTNAAGRGHAHAVVDWTFRPGAARSVVIHDTTTNSTGTAGPKLACLDIAF